MRFITILTAVAAIALACLPAVLSADEKPAEPTTKPAAGAATQPAPDRPFNGKDLDGWVTKRPGGDKGFWTVGSAKLNPDNPRELTVSPAGSELINAKGHGVDMYSKYLHGDAVIKLEVMVPRGSNSGIYVMGEYEIQVLDSYGRDQNPGKGDMGALYGAAPPTKPKYLKPGEWQTYEIHFRAPRFDAAGKKVGNAVFLKILLNGVTIHENVAMKGPTPGGVSRKEKPKGPLMFQGNHGAVAFRKIEIYPLPAAEKPDEKQAPAAPAAKPGA